VCGGGGGWVFLSPVYLFYERTHGRNMKVVEGWGSQYTYARVEWGLEWGSSLCHGRALWKVRFPVHLCHGRMGFRVGFFLVPWKGTVDGDGHKLK
jgi:hypothetical protein